MRIGLVVSGGVDRSGREHVIPALLWFIERLARHHAVIVYVLRYHTEPCTYRLGDAIVRDLGSPVGVWRQHAALTRALRADGPFDLLHAYWALPAGLAGGAAGRRLRIPVVVTLDSGEFAAVPSADYGLQRRTRQRLAVAAALRMAQRVTVCSQYQQQLARAHGVNPMVIPLGVDRTVFTRTGRIEGPPWRLIHVANLNRVKDQPTLLRAMRRVIATEPRMHLDIVGLDTLHGAIQNMAAALDIAAHVTFHGFLPTDRILPLYHRAHLSVLSSRHEAAGVVTLEAAACGVPSVGTAVGYIHDWTPDRAVAVPPGDSDALAEHVLGLLAQPGRRTALAEAAYRWALHHDADWTAAAFEALYRTVVRRPPP